MHHIIYQTTNLVNNKIYIGVHSTDDIDDNYLGSGVHLKRAVKKYGRESFLRQVLCECSSANEAYEIEELVVDEIFVGREDTYNLCIGGRGGAIHVDISLETRKKMSDAKKGIWREDHNMFGRNHSTEANEKNRQSHLGKKHSAETKVKMSDKRRGTDNANHKYLWHTPEGVFESAYRAAEAFGLGRKTIEQRCNKGVKETKVRGKPYTWKDLGWWKEDA